MDIGGIIMGFGDQPKSKNSVRLSIFGLENYEDPEASFALLLQSYYGKIRKFRLNTKKNIAEITWHPHAQITKEEIISAVFSQGLAAEELN